jgi:hypothetical protein
MKIYSRFSNSGIGLWAIIKEVSSPTRATLWGPFAGFGTTPATLAGSQ